MNCCQIKLVLYLCFVVVFQINLPAQNTAVADYENANDLINLIREYSTFSIRQADSLYNQFEDSYNGQFSSTDLAKVHVVAAAIKSGNRKYDLARALLDSAESVFERKERSFYVELSSVFDIRAEIYQRYRNYDSSLIVLEKALKYAELSKSKVALANAYNRYGNNYWYAENYFLALESYKKALKLRVAENDSIRLGGAYRNIGLVYNKLGEYNEALEYYLKAQIFFKALNSKTSLQSVYNSMGILYKEIGQFEKSLEFHNLAKEIRKSEKDTLGWALSLTNIGSTLIEQGNIKGALDSLLISLELSKNISVDNRQYVTLVNIGVCYEKMGDYRQAKKFYIESLTDATKFKDLRGEARVYNNLSNLLRSEGSYTNALNYAQKSLSISKELGTNESLLSAHQQLFLSYRALRNYEKALYHHEEFVSKNLEIFSDANVKEISKLKAKYEYDRQRDELLIKDETIESLGKENDHLEGRSTLYLLLLLILCIVVLFIILLNRSRLKRIELEKSLLNETASRIELDKTILSNELKIQELQLKAYAEQLSQKNDMISTFENRLKDYEKEISYFSTSKLTQQASKIEGRSGSNLSWDEFRLKFDKTHPEFLPKLISQNSDLTSNDLDVCLLLRLNLSYKDISSILGVSYEGVRKSVQRLYKKLSLKSVDELRTYLIQIAS